MFEPISPDHRRVGHGQRTGPALPVGRRFRILLVDVMTGDPETYGACRQEARRLRSRGVRGFVAPSAAVRPGTPSGFRTEGGLRPGPARPERAFVVFGPRPDLVGWVACAVGRPGPDLLERVRHLAD